MDYMNLGIIVLAAVMVWLLYKVTKETRQFIASNKRRVVREVRATGVGPAAHRYGENTPQLTATDTGVFSQALSFA